MLILMANLGFRKEWKTCLFSGTILAKYVLESRNTSKLNIDMKQEQVKYPKEGKEIHKQANSKLYSEEDFDLFFA